MPTTTKPLTAADWTTGLPTQIAQPTPSLQASGFTPGQRPTAQHLNFLLYNLGQWVSYLDQTANGAVSTLEIGQSMRLTGGGVWYYSASAPTLGWSEPFILSTPSIPDTQNTVAAGTVPIQPGQVAYIIANLPFATMASTTSGSTSLTNVQYEVGITAGQTVTGNGIVSGTTVVSVNGTTVTISKPASATASSVVVTFVSSATPMVQVANIASLQPAPNVIIIATVTPMYAIVGVNSGQMRVYDGEQKRLLNSGFVHSYSTQAGSTLSFGQIVYISPGGVDSDAFQATTTSGSPTLTAVSSTANIMPGSVISGTGIPQATTVTAVGTNSLSLSANATSSGTGVSLQSQRIAGAAYLADAARANGLVRGNVAGLVTATPNISQSAASPVRYMTGGTLGGYTGLSVGAVYYLNPAVPGGMTTTQPLQSAYTSPIGVATSTTALYVQPLAMARPQTADSLFNDVTLSSISGSSNPVQLQIYDGNNTLQTSLDNAGNAIFKGKATAGTFANSAASYSVDANGNQTSLTTLVSAGTAATPSQSFAADNTTGTYLSVVSATSAALSWAVNKIKALTLTATNATFSVQVNAPYYTSANGFKQIVDMGYFFANRDGSGNNNAPTTFVNTLVAAVNPSSGATSNMNAAYLATHSGSIVGCSVYVNDALGTGNTVSVQVIAGNVGGPATWNAVNGAPGSTATAQSKNVTTFGNGSQIVAYIKFNNAAVISRVRVQLTLEMDG